MKTLILLAMLCFCVYGFNHPEAAVDALVRALQAVQGMAKR